MQAYSFIFCGQGPINASLQFLRPVNLMISAAGVPLKSRCDRIATVVVVLTCTLTGESDVSSCMTLDIRFIQFLWNLQPQLVQKCSVSLHVFEHYCLISYNEFNLDPQILIYVGLWLLFSNRPILSIKIWLEGPLENLGQDWSIYDYQWNPARGRTIGFN